MFCAKSPNGEVLLYFPSMMDGNGGGEYDRFDSLLDRRSIDKISKVNDKTWIAFSGLSGDGRFVIQAAQSYSLKFYSKFGFTPAVSSIARSIGELQHESTITRGI